MRWVVATLVAGCTTYHAPPAPTDSFETPDANDGPAAGCAVGATGTPIDRGTVGLSTGGGTIGALQCDGTDRMVGIALDMSDGLAEGVTRSARGITIACATLSIDGTGGHVGPIATKQILGNGGSGFSPSTSTPVARCPDDAVVSGLSVHGSSFTTYFLDATLQCTRLDTKGKPLAIVGVPITGSGTDANNPSSATCDASEQLSALSANTGAGLDTVQLKCQETSCQ